MKKFTKFCKVVFADSCLLICGGGFVGLGCMMIRTGITWIEAAFEVNEHR